MLYFKNDELKIAEKAHFRRFVLFQYSILYEALSFLFTVTA